MIRRFIVLLLVGLTGCTQASTETTFAEGLQALTRGNFAEAYCRWKPLADYGHAESQYNLGWLYANGNGMHVNILEAHRWWRAAANQNHADAQFSIGLSYTNGEGVEQDIQEATNWFLLAARQGHQDAQEILLRLSSDPRFDLISANPTLVKEPWFGKDGIILTEVANIRVAANTKAKIAARLPKDTQVRVVGQVGDWLRIILPESENNETAWVYRTLVKPIETLNNE